MDTWEDLGYKPLERGVVFDPTDNDEGKNDYLANYPREMSREEGIAEWRRQLRRAS